MAQAETAQGAQRWRHTSHSRIGDEAFLSHVYSDSTKTNVRSPLDACLLLTNPLLLNLPLKQTKTMVTNASSFFPHASDVPLKLKHLCDTTAHRQLKASSFGSPLFCHRPAKLYLLFSGDLHVKLVSFSLFCQTSQSTSASERSHLSRRCIPACTKTSDKRQTGVDRG